MAIFPAGLFTYRLIKVNRERSSQLFAAARRVIPGGVNSPARAFGAVGGEPPFIERGLGAYLWDVDGHRYIDYVGSWGPLIWGHAHPHVTQAIQEAISRGTSFGAPTEAETRLAELIVQAVPSIEKMRLVNSGTEATMSAIRLARGFTGRDKIIKFAGNYHGHVDSLLVAAGSSAATLAVPDSPGVTRGASHDTIILPYNDPQAIYDTFVQYSSELAAVILEPIVGNMGCVVPTREFLAAVREATHRAGTLLIYDEVMTGFRVAYGGAQSLQGIVPDLTTLGKIVGGGLPVGAYGGRADIMDAILPVGKVFQAGTLSGNPLATAAGIAVLERLRDEPPYAYLETLGARLEAGITQAATSAGIGHSFTRIGSMMTLFFSDGRIDNWDTARQCRTDQFARYFWNMLDRHIYLPCSQFEALFISAAHAVADIDATIAAAREAFVDCRVT